MEQHEDAAGGHRRITLSDVAAHAGVSRATASLVVRSAGNLSDATRERVKASMAALGYVYHRGAASLRAKHSQTVGLIVADVSNPFTAELTIAIEETLAKAGIVTLLSSTREDTDRQDLLIRSMIERQVDGLILTPAIGTEPSALDPLALAGVPTVLTTRRLASVPQPYLGIDQLGGARLACEHLISHNPGSIGYLGGPGTLVLREERSEGIRMALEAAGLPPLALDLPGSVDPQWARRATHELLESDRLPEAILCHNDTIAFGVYRALREAGRDIANYRIASFDDVAEAALWEPPLTSVSARGAEVGERSAEMMLRRIAEPGAEPETALLRPLLTVRRSCGCEGV